jgi:tetratricopeptide (TPR) repeat protein
MPRQRFRQWLHARGPRTRFYVYSINAGLGRQTDVSVWRELALELARERKFAEALRCWRYIHRRAPFNGRILSGRLACALEARNAREALRAFHEVWNNGGLPPSQVVRLAGELVCIGEFEDAARVLVELAELQSADKDVDIIHQSPSILVGLVPRDFNALADELNRLGNDRDGACGLYRKLARLCFTLGRVGTAAKLYRKVSASFELETLDQVAMLYGEASSRSARSAPADHATMCGLLDDVGDNADASFALGCVALVTGHESLALDAVRQALVLKHGAAENFDRIEQDCGAILAVLERLKDRELNLSGEVLNPVVRENGRVPKVFICGFGWSGSSAVYDDIRGMDGFCEFEGAGRDAILNEDAESEVTFIQSTAGIGTLWRALRAGQPLTWQMLWDLFALHVAGLAPIGYSSYKSCSATANHIRLYGARYTTPFRTFFEKFATLLDNPERGGMCALLQKLTESLCEAVTEQTGRPVVLFNNAISGRNVVMLELFGNSRVVSVYRDPLDVLADRINKDRNHWRTPRQLAAFYGDGLKRYAAYKMALPSQARTAFHEVAFERFVRDGAFRRQVREWITGGVAPVKSRSHFNPAVSSGNIGIHEDIVGSVDETQLAVAVAAYDEMERLAALSWDDNR